MRILLSNDDSINAEGLMQAATALHSVGEVFVVAPDRNQSGIGTATDTRRIQISTRHCRWELERSHKVTSIHREEYRGLSSCPPRRHVYG